jgi:phosphatidylserine/phosphatidylglycerophosphate/cardiolipin synthase-like enzyme
LLDPTQPQNIDAFGLLRSAGAVVRLYRQSRDELLHAKLGIFDAGAVLFGSCNWSRSGFTRNHELDLLINEPGLARTFLSRMEQDWAVSAP